MTKYIKSTERLEDILKAACFLAENDHYKKIRRHHLSDMCRTAAGNVSRVVGTMEQMRTMLIEYAIRNDRSIVITQAIVDRHPAVQHLTKEEQRRHVDISMDLQSD